MRDATPTKLNTVAEAAESQELGGCLSPAGLPPTERQSQVAEATESISMATVPSTDRLASETMQGPVPVLVMQKAWHLASYQAGSTPSCALTKAVQPCIVIPICCRLTVLARPHALCCADASEGSGAAKRAGEQMHGELPEHEGGTSPKREDVNVEVQLLATTATHQDLCHASQRIGHPHDRLPCCRSLDCRRRQQQAWLTSQSMPANPHKMRRRRRPRLQCLTSRHRRSHRRSRCAPAGKHVLLRWLQSVWGRSNVVDPICESNLST